MRRIESFAKLPILFVLAFVTLASFSQKPLVEIINSGTKTSLRGLSVVNDNVVWVSGSNGKVGRTNNGGKNWNWFTVKGFEKAEFRDIEAFDASTAIIMAIAEPAYLLKTSDGGESWKIVYENTTKGMFLDAMDFLGEKYGIVVGDPIDKKILLAETFDGGNSWKERSTQFTSDSGEAFFAASGTNLRILPNKKFVLVSGGIVSRFISNDNYLNLPIIQGKESTGANSIAVYSNSGNRKVKKMTIAGGDFNAASSNYKNCYYTTNGGKSWKAPKISPHGYRSCVEYLSKKDVLSCGLNGVDYSSNGGKIWKWISKESFNTCRIAKLGTTIYLVGNNGKIAKITWK